MVLHHLKFAIGYGYSPSRNKVMMILFVGMFLIEVIIAVYIADMMIIYGYDCKPRYIDMIII